jgi:hypothetical protein
MLINCDVQNGFMVAVSASLRKMYPIIIIAINVMMHLTKRLLLKRNQDKEKKDESQQNPSQPKVSVCQSDWN